MKNNGWIKLHRQLLDNPILEDHLAFSLFVFLLLSADRKTGTYRTGRYFLGEVFSCAPTTIYGALKRLEERYKMIKISADNKKSTITLLNWAFYQGNRDEPTPNRHQTDTKPTLNKKRISREVVLRTTPVGVVSPLSDKKRRSAESPIVNKPIVKKVTQADMWALIGHVVKLNGARFGNIGMQLKFAKQLLLEFDLEEIKETATRMRQDPYWQGIRINLGQLATNYHKFSTPPPLTMEQEMVLKYETPKERALMEKAKKNMKEIGL